MRILALEVSGKTGSVAVLDDERLLDELSLPQTQRTAQSLAPALQACLARVNWLPGHVGLVAVTSGPGSFTGLRLGMTTAKTFAYATGCDILGIDTLRVIAAQAGASGAVVCAVLDAQREQFYAASFQRSDDGRVRPVRPTHIIDRDQWLAELTPGTIVTGPGLATRRGKLLDRLPAGVPAADAAIWSPRAATVGRLASTDFREGRRDDLWRIKPNYFRKSAAEEKWEGGGGRG